MQVKEQNQFYDKLLRYLNKSFFTNLKTQELYLDLTKNTRKLRFKSIKNIYNTLTEGKADQIIFNKEKTNLINSTSYNHLKTQRTCWRLIQKLITKIAYYLTNERGLKELAPSILRAVGFTRRATDKINHTTTFLQFFSDVVNLLMEENSILEKKIYNILIQRGYISSVDEFYKMSRFQSNSDFMYNTMRKQSDSINTISDKDPLLKTSPATFNLTDKKSRKGLFSTKKLFRNRVSIFQGFNLEEESEVSDKKEDKRQSSDVIRQSEITSESAISEKSEQDENVQKLNKFNHNVHEQVEKVIQQLVQHPDFNVFLQSINDKETSPHLQPNKDKKQPVIKDIIKNIRLKKFKANQKLLQINEKDLMTGSSERKNSQPKVNDIKNASKTKGKLINHRTSIATALSCRVKEKVFKEKGIRVMEDLIIRNLGELEKKKKKYSLSKSTQSRQQLPEKNIVRHKKRQQTQNIEPTEAPILHNEKHRRSSNFHFLSNAFIFNKHFKRFNNSPKLFQGKKTALSSQDNQFSSQELETVFSGRKIEASRRSSTESRQTIEGALFSNEKLVNYSRFAQQTKPNLTFKKKNHRSRNEFNTAILDFAARKYNRYSGSQDYLNLQDNQGNVVNWQTLFQQDDEEMQPKQKKMLETKMQPLKIKKEGYYVHHRKYDIFDRRYRRIL